MRRRRKRIKHVHDSTMCPCKPKILVWCDELRIWVPVTRSEFSKLENGVTYQFKHDLKPVDIW